MFVQYKMSDKRLLKTKSIRKRRSQPTRSAFLDPMFAAKKNEPEEIGFDRRFVLHGRNVDFGPGLKDGQLLQRQRALVVDDGRRAKRVMTVSHFRVKFSQ